MSGERAFRRSLNAYVAEYDYTSLVLSDAGSFRRISQLDTTNSDGETPLFNAARYGRTAVRAPLHPVTSVNLWSRAASAFFKKVSDTAVSPGRCSSQCVAEPTTRSDLCPRMHNHSTRLRRLLCVSPFQVVKFLIDKGASIRHRDASKRTPLHRCAMGGARAPARAASTSLP